MKKYKQIVFDVDGTLADTQYADVRSLQDTLRALSGREVALEELAFAFGITGRDTLKILHVDEADISRYLSLWTENLHNYKDTVGVFKGIPEMLEALVQSGYELGIVTSRTKEEFADDFADYGIESYFKTIVCADDTREHKPAPAPLLKYAELAGCGMDEVLYIGDSRYDMECAANAGVDFGLAGWGAKSGLKAAYIFQTPSDVIKSLAHNQA